MEFKDEKEYLREKVNKPIDGYSMMDKEIQYEKKLKEKNDKICMYGSIMILITGLLIYFLMKKTNILFTEIIPSHQIKKPLYDKKNYKLLKLRTGTEVLLINDKDTKKSSASLGIEVGTFFDITPGLAHFCEHMIFLGSKKYKSPSEFTDILSMYNGNYNAFTMKDKTIYYFEVDNLGFEKTLDIFSGFFTKPLFTENYISKEINAINSEYKIIKTSDHWLCLFIMQNEGNLKHPFSNFDCGSNETLGNVEARNLRQELKYFFENFYTPDNTKLVLISNYSIEYMEKLIDNNFFIGYVDKLNKLKYKCPLTNQFYEINSILEKEPIYNEKDFTKLIYYKSANGQNNLNIYFIFKSLYKNYEYKSFEYFNYTFSYEGEKSFKTILTQKGFIDSIKWTAEEYNKYFSTFKLNLLLTEKGIQNYEFIIKVVFGYINLIQNQEISSEIYKEIEEILNIQFNTPSSKDLYEKAIEHTIDLFEHKPEDILYGSYKTNFSKKEIKNFIESISIDNCIIIIGSNNGKLNHDLNFHSVFEKKKTPITDLSYFVSYLKKDVIEEIKSFKEFNNMEINLLFDNDTIKNLKSLKFKDVINLRTKNKFIPKINDNHLEACYDKEIFNKTKSVCLNGEFIPEKILEIMKNDVTQSEYDKLIENNYIPINLLKKKFFEFWYKIDNSFHTPKENIKIGFESKLFIENKRNYIMYILLEQYLILNINKYLSEAIQTDNSISVLRFRYRLLIDMNIYSDLDKIIMDELIKIFSNMLKANLNKIEEDFNLMKSKAINLVKETKSQKAYRKSDSYFYKFILNDITIINEISEDDILDTKINDFQNFLILLSNNLLIKILIHGNTNKQKVELIYNSFSDEIFNKNKLNIITEDNFDIKYKKLLENNLITFYFINNFKDDENHATSFYYQIHNAEKYSFYKENLLLKLYDKCIGNYYFEKLRTERQLGYIVANRLIHINKEKIYYEIFVQGTKKLPDEVELDINEIVKETTEINCENKFKELKNAVLYDIKVNDDQLKLRTNYFWNEIIFNKYLFNKKQIQFEIMKDIKNYKEVAKFIKYNFIENPIRIGIFNYANKYEISEVKKRINNINKNKNFYGSNNKNKIVYTDNINYF